jgi:uncharacterized coiled-coil protein SlyX
VGDVVKRKYLTIREAAELTGVHPVTLRRRLLHLHDVHGGVLVSFERPGARRGKYFVRRDRLMAVWASEDEAGRPDDERDEGAATDERVTELEHKLAEQDAKVLALRNTLRATRAELASLRRDTERRLSQFEGRWLQVVGTEAA